VQPFVAAGTLLYLGNLREGASKPESVVVIETIGNSSSQYFIIITLLIITLMSAERLLHMCRRLLVTSRRVGFTTVVLLILPVPFAVFRSFDTFNNKFGIELNISAVVGMIICFLITCFSYFNVFGIICRHQRQVQANVSSQSFVQPAINLAKYRKTVFKILYILVVFSLRFLPYIVYVGLYAYKGYIPVVAMIN